MVAVRSLLGNNALSEESAGKWPGFIGSDFDVASGTCTQCESLPACEIVMRILSVKMIVETVVKRLCATPDVVLEGAGKGDGRTSGDAMVDQ